MDEKHKQQISQYAEEALAALGDEGSQAHDKEQLKNLVNLDYPFDLRALEGINADDDILVYAGVQVGESSTPTSLVLTQGAIYLTSFAIFSGKVKYRERIGAESISGVELRAGSGLMSGVHTMLISRTSERDEIRFYQEFPANSVKKVVDTWLNGTKTSAGSVTESPAETLLKLKQLLDAGVLSQEEFDLKKTELMGRI